MQKFVQQAKFLLASNHTGTEFLIPCKTASNVENTVHAELQNCNSTSHEYLI